MKLAAIRQRTVILEMDPEEAAMISKACQAAELMNGGSDAEHIFPENNHGLMYYFQNISSILEASAVAALVEDYSYDASRQVTLENLRLGTIGEWGVQ